mmetsp:Transcript_14886/g.42964  ORF Transcript_14886/g.42964 Transcript_14886/m.42964 type:complete len:233 (-) Transcript_14886:121-819(-)
MPRPNQHQKQRFHLRQNRLLGHRPLHSRCLTIRNQHQRRLPLLPLLPLLQRPLRPSRSSVQSQHQRRLSPLLLPPLRQRPPQLFPSSVLNQPLNRNPHQPQHRLPNQRFLSLADRSQPPPKLRQRLLPLKKLLQLGQLSLCSVHPRVRPHLLQRHHPRTVFPCWRDGRRMLMVPSPAGLATLLTSETEPRLPHHRFEREPRQGLLSELGLEVSIGCPRVSRCACKNLRPYIL